MSLFEKINFNGEVFGRYANNNVPDLTRTEMLKSGAIVMNQAVAAMLPDQTGGNFVTVPIKGGIGGEPDNYDGTTDMTSDTRETYTHSRIAVGRMHSWDEKDFNKEISGDTFEAVASEVARYWDKVDQKILYSVLKGIYSMTGEENEEFVNEHTYREAKFTEITLNNAIQQALGDNKDAFVLAIMHSRVATNLENLNLLEYLKYTDSNGVQRNLTLATLNGRTVIIDDGVPTENISAGYVKVSKEARGALKVVDSGAKDGEVLKSAVTGDVPGAEAGDYVVYQDGGIAYTTYVFGNGAIELSDCGVKVPYEVGRDPKTAGGVDTLYSRQRKIYSPVGISYTDTSVISPANSDLEKGENWELANTNAKSGKKYYPHKAIPITRIITNG